MKQIVRSDARVRRARSSSTAPSVASMIESLESRQLLSAVIKVYGNGTLIAVKDKTPALTDETDFGPVTLKGAFSSSTRTFTVKNTGTTTLNLAGSRVALSGSDPSDFTITQNLPATIAAGKRASFTIKFDPAGRGNSGADITVSSDGNHSAYRYHVSGSGLKTTRFSNGLEIATTTTGTGPQVVDGEAMEMNYNGFFQTGKLFDSSFGRSPFMFAIGKQQVISGWDQGLADTRVGDARTLFIPSALGYGTAGSGSAIPPNTPLIFQTFTLGVGPSLKVTGGTSAIRVADGDTSPSLVDSTEFGAIKKGKTKVQTYVISADITAMTSTPAFTDTTTPVHVVGANASDFTVAELPSTGDGTVHFTVTFKPSSTGTRTATIDIPNNNPNDPDYTFAIEGKGT